MYSLTLLILTWITLSASRCHAEMIVAGDLADGGPVRCEVHVPSAVEVYFLITVTKELHRSDMNQAYTSTLSMGANTSDFSISFGEDALLCASDTDVTVENTGNVTGELPDNYIELQFIIHASDSPEQCNGSSTCIRFDAVAVSEWLPQLQLDSFTVDCSSLDEDTSVIILPEQIPVTLSILIGCFGLVLLLFLLALACCLRKCRRVRKMRHVYATFDTALASGRSSQVQRTVSRRPTRSLPPIPEPSPKAIHYANAHLRLSQNSMPARLRHSMHSDTSELTVPEMNCRNSLPLHASNVSAQNALYFFTRPGDLSPKDIPVEKTQGFTFPYNCDKPTPSKGLFKHHTMNHRSSTLFRKGRSSDYQNWFQRFELSTSCPSIDAVEEGREPADKVKTVLPLRPKVEKRKRRSMIRSRLSFAHRDREQTLPRPRSKLPSLSRPLSEALLSPVNPYVERRNVPSSCYSK